MQNELATHANAMNLLVSPIVLAQSAGGTISTGRTLLVPDVIGPSTTSSAAYVVWIVLLALCGSALSHYAVYSFFFLLLPGGGDTMTTLSPRTITLATCVTVSSLVSGLIDISSASSRTRFRC